MHAANTDRDRPRGRAWRRALRGAALLSALALSVLVLGCEEDDCTTTGCPADRICNRTSGRCDVPPKPACDTVSCPADQACDPATGTCVQRTTFCRVDPEDCPADAPCSICAEGLVCDASSGLCLAACRYLNCARNEVCDEATNACAPIRCRTDDDCPGGTVCPARDVCTVGCRNGDDCAANEFCDLDDAAVGNCRSLCSVDADCPWGWRCEPEASRSRCATEPPCHRSSDCRAGETCRLDTCRRALCASDLDCVAAAEYCDAASGECRPNDCLLDEFEPNASRDQARRILPGAYAGLTLCRAEDDWYELRLSTPTDAVRIELQHDADADLDLEVYAGAERLAVGASVSSPEQVVVPTATRPSLLLHVSAARGVDLAYRMNITDEPAACDEDLYEPNDGVSRAAAVLADAPPRLLVTCPGNADVFELLPSGAGTRYVVDARTVDALPNPSDWLTTYSLGDTEPRAIEGDSGASRSVELAHVSADARLYISSIAFTPIPWSLTATTGPSVCSDPTSGNHTTATATPWMVGVPASLTRADQRLCPEGGDQTFETDWTRLDLSDTRPLVLTASLSLTSPPSFSRVALRLSLLTGDPARPWVAAYTELRPDEAADRAELRLPISRVDRPLWLRVDGPDGLPRVLERWPEYKIDVQTEVTTGCVQDNAEADGNNTLAAASPLDSGGMALGILCPDDIDVFVVDAADGVPAVRVSADGPVTVNIFDRLDSPVVGTVGIVGGAPAVNVLSNYDGVPPGGALWLRLTPSGALGQDGASYQLTVE